MDIVSYMSKPEEFHVNTTQIEKKMVELKLCVKKSFIDTSKDALLFKIILTMARFQIRFCLIAVLQAGTI